jgi:hypothetical protein
MGVKRTVAGFAVVTPLVLAACVFAHAIPPAGTWAVLPNTQLYPAMPREAKLESSPGTTPELWSPQGVFAFSGADLFEINGVWGFLIWGGGHGDSPDNSLYWLPFDGSGAKRLTGPYLAPDKAYYYDTPLESYRSVSRNAAPGVTSAGAPKARHTYSSLLRIDVHGRPAMFSYGGSLAIPSGGGTDATRIFDLSQTYAEAMARADMGWALKQRAPGTAVASSSGWDPIRRRVVTRSRGFIGAYYPDTDRWENWNIQNAPWGSDFAASVAMDISGRKMYVLGDRLAEVIDLETKAYTDLRGKPWAARFVVGPSPAGPGVAWHARTRQIVVWEGGNRLLLINPATDAVRIVTLKGETPTAAPSAGTYGRFRLIPGSDQVVLVNAVDQNVFIASVPFGDDSPAPPRSSSRPADVLMGADHMGRLRAGSDIARPKAEGVRRDLSGSGTMLALADPPSGSASSGGTASVAPGQQLPARTWVERPMPTGAIQSYMQTGGKHGRAFYHPGLKSMVFAGGDWHTSQPQFDKGDGNGVGSEIWALDALQDRWTLLRPFCVPGETQPGGPDTVVWAYDSKRNRGLMAPGFYFITQGATSPCGAIYGWGGYAFDFVTKTFVGPDSAAGLPAPPSGWGGDTGASYGVYDPVSDELMRVRNGPWVERLSLESKKWRVQPLQNGDRDWNPIPNRAQSVIDVTKRTLYWIDAWSRRPSLIKVNLGNYSIAAIPLPPQWKPPAAPDHEVYLVFDPLNRVILIPNSLDMGVSPIMGLGIYDVDAGQWQWGAVPPTVVGSVWGFDEATGAMIGIGKRSQPYSYFLYRYAPAGRPAMSRTTQSGEANSAIFAR